MIYAALYFYLAGVFPALHIAYDATGAFTWRQASFAIFWPLICPPIYAWAVWKEVRS